MSNWANTGIDEEPRVGQQYRRTDGTGLVFEVVGPVECFRQPHVRVRRVDDPTDMRVFARSALVDGQSFRAVDQAAAQPRAGLGQLRLKPS